MKSVGRFARSVEMITQRPVTGSLRSSGKWMSPRVKSNYEGLIIALAIAGKLVGGQKNSSSDPLERIAEGVAQVRYRRRHAEHDVDYIETHLAPRHFGVSGELVRGANDPPSFLPADGAVRRSKLFALPRFDFDKYKVIAIPSDQVDFARPGVQAIVARHDDDSSALQETVCDVFSTASARMFGRHVLFAAVLPKAIGKFIKEA
jgi:hypothetical protein